MLSYLCLGQKIPLRQTCRPDDICKDANAECKNSVCLCKPDFFESDGECSEYWHSCHLNNIHINQQKMASFQYCANISDWLGVNMDIFCFRTQRNCYEPLPSKWQMYRCSFRMWKRLLQMWRRVLPQRQYYVSWVIQLWFQNESMLILWLDTRNSFCV